MKKFIKSISLSIIFILILATGCDKNSLIKSSNVINQKSTQQEKEAAEDVLKSGLKDIMNGGKIVITGDKLYQSFQVPKNQKATLSKVTAWLQQAKIYKGELPKPKNTDSSKPIISNGYTGPAILNISTTNNHKITINPAFYIDKDDRNLYSFHYIADILIFNCDGQEIYLQSSPLYNWLKNDNWETEFKAF